MYREAKQNQHVCRVVSLTSNFPGLNDRPTQFQHQENQQCITWYTTITVLLRVAVYPVYACSGAYKLYLLSLVGASFFMLPSCFNLVNTFLTLQKETFLFRIRYFHK